MLIFFFTDDSDEVVQDWHCTGFHELWEPGFKRHTWQGHVSTFVCGCFFFFFFFVGCQSPITTLWSIFLWLLVLWGTFWMLTVMLFVHLNELVFYQCSQLFWSHFVFCRCLKISSDMPWFWWLVMPTCNRQKLDKCKERRLLI
jgi:hypothetical protein